MAIDRKQLIYGIASLIVPIQGRRKHATGGTSFAPYCYSVWLRHLVMANRNGLCRGVPGAVAELGPGDSVGIGLAALISGAHSYIGLDVVKFASLEKNIAVFDELIELFRRRAPIPSGEGFTDVKPYLDSYAFPSAILNDTHLAQALDENRLARIRSSLLDTSAPDSCIRYVAPWLGHKVEEASLDFIFSQAVMEYIDDLPAAYRTMAQWLKPGGFVSHQIDFKSHRTADTWDGHWACPDLLWRLMRGRRPFYLNRAVHSQQVAAMTAAGLRILHEERVTMAPQTERRRLNPRFRHFSDEDLSTAGAFIQAIKPA